MKKPSDIMALPIKAVKGFVTNVDWADLRENFALRTRGFRYDLEGTCGTRDYGTQDRMPSYPAPPSAVSTMTLAGGSSVVVDGSEYDVVAGTDSSNNLHLYVWSGAAWVELTEQYYAYIKTQPTTAVVTIAGNVAGDLVGLKNLLNATVYNAPDAFNGWIVHNVTKGHYAWVKASTASAAPATFCTLTIERDISEAGTSHDHWHEADELRLYRHSITKTAWASAMGGAPFVSWLPIAELERLNFYYETYAGVQKQPVCTEYLATTRTYFPGITVAGTPTAAQSPTLSGWNLIAGGGGLCPDYQTAGTATTGLDVEWAVGTGTNIVTSTSTTITGTATKFTEELQVGCYLYFLYADTSVEVLRVVDIASNTSLTVSATPTKAETITTWSRSTQTTSGTSVQDGNGYTWLYVGAHRSDAVASDSKKHAIRFIVCAVYDEYQISDPIARIYHGYNAGMATYWPLVSMGFSVCYELMPKNITGLRVYANETNNTDNPIEGEWVDSSAGYKFIQQINLVGTAASNQATWRLIPNTITSDLRYQITHTTEFTESFVNAQRSGGTPLSVDIAHAVDISRTYMTPRYAIRNRRVLNALVVTDRNDDTLAVSNVNGSGVAEQDNFPDLTADVNNNKLSVFLVTQGKLYGLAMLDDIAHAFKRTAIEKFDAQSGQQWTIEADFLARRSIVVAEDAIYWAGESAIWRLRKGSNYPEIVNRHWQNFYNGTLGITTSGGIESPTIPYMTSAYRTAIIGGYDPKYREVWFHSQVNKDTSGSEYLCFRYQIQDELWNVRELNVTGSVAKWFGMTQDRVMTIGTGGKLLKYPTIAATLPYQDEVTYAGTTGNGIPTKQTIHCGSLYAIESDFVADSVEVDHDGSAIAPEPDPGFSFDLQFIANKELSAYTSKTVPISTKTLPMGLPRRGPLSRLRIYIGLPTAWLTSFQNFSINTIVLNVVKRLKIGNK